MPEIYSFVEGAFARNAGEPVELLNSTTEEVAATARCGGVDGEAALRFARTNGLAALHGMTFAERGELLGKMAATIHEHRDDLIDCSVQNGGSTRGGAKFDIDGAAGTLAAYAAIGKELGDCTRLADGEGIGLGRGARLHGRHMFSSRHGVAVLINAFNFPAWGFAEKAATALLAGMPVVNKPATATAWTAGRLTEILVEAGLLPDGAFTQILGPITSLLEKLGPQDVVAFTGSSGTAAKVKGLPQLLLGGVHVNVEADSLNAAVLDPEVENGSPCYQLFVRDVVREMTEKTGQKCTATRRLIVPEGMVDQVVADLTERLQGLKIGNPTEREVAMGPLATRQQNTDVHAGLERLKGACEHAFGEGRPAELINVPDGKGFFVGPNLLIARDGAALEEVHSEEVFGPVATILPYGGEAAAAVELVERGGGMLVSSVYADDRKFLLEVARGIAPHCGRVCLIDSKSEGFSLPTGMVMPQLIHGGPGRAGGGEELGGLRGVHHFLHRTALQGARGLIDKAVN